MKKFIFLCSLILLFLVVNGSAVFAAELKLSDVKNKNNVLINPKNEDEKGGWTLDGYRFGKRDKGDPTSGKTGNYFFLPAPNKREEGSFYQEIYINDKIVQDLIDKEQLCFDLEYYFHGAEVYDDYAVTNIICYGEEIKKYTTTNSYFWRQDMGAKGFDWHHFNLLKGKPIPKGTRRIEVKFEAKRVKSENHGAALDAYFDGITFKVYDPHPPVYEGTTAFCSRLADDSINKYFKNRSKEYLAAGDTLFFKMQFNEDVTNYGDDIRIKLNVKNAQGDYVYAQPKVGWMAGLYFEYEVQPGDKVDNYESIEIEPVKLEESDKKRLTFIDMAGNEWNRNFGGKSKILSDYDSGKEFTIDTTHPVPTIHATAEKYKEYSKTHEGIQISTTKPGENVKFFIDWYKGKGEEPFLTEEPTDLTNIKTPDVKTEWNMVVRVYDEAWNEGTAGPMLFDQLDDVPPEVTKVENNWVGTHMAQITVIDSESGLKEQDNKGCNVKYTWSYLSDLNAVKIEDCGDNESVIGTDGEYPNDTFIPLPSRCSGNYFLHVFAVDTENNIAHKFFQYTITGPSIEVEGDFSIKKSYDVKVTATDEQGIKLLKYKLQKDSEVVKDWEVIQSGDTIPVTQDITGELELYIYSEDEYGNYSEYTKIFKIDCTPPYVNFDNSTVDPGTTDYLNNISIKYSVSDEDNENGFNSGVSLVYWQWVEDWNGEGVPVPNNDKWQQIPVENTLFNTIPQGVQRKNCYLFFKVIDNAGNETIKNVIQKIDTASPVVYFSPNGTSGKYQKTASTQIIAYDGSDIQYQNISSLEYGLSSSNEHQPDIWINAPKNGDTMQRVMSPLAKS